MTAVARFGILTATLLAALLASGPLAAQDRVVRVVLFFSPTCPHCHEVITRDLPLFFQVHGGEPQVWMDEPTSEGERALYLLYNAELEVLLVDAARPVGGRLYEASMRSHPVDAMRSGVPRMIMGTTVLVGSREIPSEFHDLFADAESIGALEWPAIQGLEAVAVGFPSATTTAAAVDATDATDAVDTTGATDAVDATEAADTAVGHSGGQADTADAAGGRAGGQADSAAAPVLFRAIAERPTSVGERFRQDPVGNGLAVAVLILMLASAVALLRGVGTSQIVRPGTGIPLLAAVGIGVAAYLAYVETTGALAVCGPVGDCNAVQQSSYARLFGVLPVGALGLAGYVAMIGAWIVARGNGRVADWARVTLLAMTAFGMLFSIYLTFLEPFVIGATCAWCLTSAVIVTLLLWLSAGPGTVAWRRLRTAR